MTRHAMLLAATLAAPFPPGAVAQRPTPSVTVANTPAHPVPITAVGTTAIAGGVSVTNTPSVAVEGPVAVSNPADRDLHFAFLDCTFAAATSGGRMCTATALVPVGMRFVIKSAQFYLPFPGATAMGEITVFTGSGQPNSWTGPIALASPLNGYLWARAETTLFADAQRNGSYGIRVHCFTSADASPRTCNVQLYGYVIDCTSATCRNF